MAEEKNPKEVVEIIKECTYTNGQSANHIKRTFKVGEKLHVHPAQKLDFTASGSIINPAFKKNLKFHGFIK